MRLTKCQISRSRVHSYYWKWCWLFSTLPRTLPILLAGGLPDPGGKPPRGWQTSCLEFLHRSFPHFTLNSLAALCGRANRHTLNPELFRSLSIIEHDARQCCYVWGVAMPLNGRRAGSWCGTAEKNLELFPGWEGGREVVGWRIYLELDVPARDTWRARKTSRCTVVIVYIYTVRCTKYTCIYICWATGRSLD